MRGRGIRDWCGLAALLGLWLSASALGASPALGYFSAGGSGTLTAGVGALTVPTLSAQPATGGTVALTWATGEAPGAVAYYVTRDGEAPGGNCPSAAEPANDLGTCTDSGLEPGTYTYKVFAKYRSWTATGAPLAAKVTVGPADHFVLAVSSSTPVAGASVNLTITAKDKAGSTVTTYTGSHSLTFEGAAVSPGGTVPTVVNSAGTAVAFGTATALNFTSGAATVTSSKNGVMKLYRAAAATISVTDGSIESTIDPTVTVSPTTFSKLALTAASATPAVATEDALTVTATDGYGNTVPTYTGSHSLKYSGPVASPTGQPPTVTDGEGNQVAIGTATPTNFVKGIATASEGKNGGLTLYKAAAASVKVAEGSVTSATVTITATAGPATSLKLVAATTAPVAGASDSLTTTALDVYGNTATSYAGTKNITFSGPEASPSAAAATVANSSGTAVPIGTATPLTFTAGVATVNSTKNGVFKAAKAAATTLGATDGTISTPAPIALTVAPGTAARFAWSTPTVSAGALGSPCLFTCTVTTLGNSGTFAAKLAVTDSLGNIVSNLGTGHAATVTATGGSVTGGTLTIAETGPAESTTTFTYTSPTTGTFTNTITAAKSLGTAYTSATATAMK